MLTVLHLSPAEPSGATPPSVVSDIKSLLLSFPLAFASPLLFSSVFFFKLIIHWDFCCHPVALKEEAEFSKPEEFTGKPLCGGKWCFIVHLTDQLMVNLSCSTRNQHYIMLSFDVIDLKYAVFSKNNCWCGGFLMAFKESFFTLMKRNHFYLSRT